MVSRYPARFLPDHLTRHEEMSVQAGSGFPEARACPAGAPGRTPIGEGNLPMNVNPLTPGGGDSPRLPALLLAVAAAVLSAQSEAWASALGTAAAIYTVIATSNRDHRS